MISAWAQVLSNVTDTEPLTRNAVIRTMAEQQARIELEDTSESREPLCAQHANGLMMTRDQSMHLASQLKALCEQAVGADVGAGVGGRNEMSLRGMRDISMSLRGRGAGGAAGDSSGVGSGSMLVEISAHGPRVLDRALERATGGLIEVLNQGSGVELWCENRLFPASPLLL